MGSPCRCVLDVRIRQKLHIFAYHGDGKVCHRDGQPGMGSTGRFININNTTAKSYEGAQVLRPKGYSLHGMERVRAWIVRNCLGNNYEQ